MRGNKMAIANIRERLQLHFDAEGALESRVRRRRLRGPHPDAVSHDARDAAAGERSRVASGAMHASRPTPPPRNARRTAPWLREREPGGFAWLTRRCAC